MSIVNAGNTFKIYDDSVKTYNVLPVGCYQIAFEQMSGFYLTKHNELSIVDSKIYGNIESKVNKILNSYKQVNRNFGVILSGDKGVGKSLFAKVLANKANKIGIPLILATKNYKGIEDFISSIEGEVIVLFDEFEKNFPCEYEYDSDCDHELGADGGVQDSLLSLFDGIDSGKKLFVITCNDTYKLSKYFLNRPGRFHYHFRLTPPSADEITEYLTDTLDNKYYEIIPTIISLSALGSMTYDCLRAISFDINQGYSLDETLDCLNITRDKDVRLKFEITTSNGKVFTDIDLIDIGKDCTRSMYLNEDEGSAELRISFNPSNIKYTSSEFTLDKSNVKIIAYNDYNEINDEIGISTERKKIDIKDIKLSKVEDSFIYRYMV